MPCLRSGTASLLFLSLFLLAHVHADIYLHNPRGCNNRRSETTADRANDNRLFNTENNARGGYSWGPSMTYYEDSVLPIQWTAQHGCGSDQVECNIVVQYMCVDNQGDKAALLRDGTTTDTIPDNAATFNTMAGGEYTYGMHESYQYYQDCKARERNRGLFTADLALNGNSAIYTRQTAAGTRYGFQCNEERDYYPYWHPSPWKDIAVMSPNKDLCGLFTKESQNVKAKNYCQLKVTGTNLVPNNEAACTSKGGVWTSEPAHGLDAPECQIAEYSRDNHLGNGPGGVTANYEWRVPSGEKCAETGCNCALRLRYNVSTANTNNWGFDDATKNGKASPVQTNPVVELEDDDLQMALNTNQYGRVFEDRSFTFHIAKRPKHVDANTPIYNLNVRGKRGNIVQAYPATEYDFVPSDLKIKEGDFVHFQWTGADTNPTGNAGEGIAGTDRSNIVQISSLNHNLPQTTAEIDASKEPALFDDSALRHHMGFTGQKNCPSVADLLKKNNNNQGAVNVDPTNCAKLNAAPAYFNAGPIRMNKTGTFQYMSSRNNNFSNRTQKGKITVDAKISPGGIAGIVVACVLGLLVALFIAGFIYSKKNPHSMIAQKVYSKFPTVKSSSDAPHGMSAERSKPLLG